MDVIEMSRSLVEGLVPFLPHLVSQVGDKALDAVGTELGKHGLAKAEQVWSKLVSREGGSEIEATAADVLATASDADAVAALRLQIRKLLQRDPTLVAELGPELAPGSEWTTVIAHGERSIAAKSVTSSVLMTGDRKP